VALGYAVVVCDLRGFGTSEGTGTMLSKQEGEDYHDLIEWAGTQPWSNGKVGLLGVSYLALSQYRAAAEQPPHLAAICPWEGFSDVYRDFAKPGGVRDRGFFAMWGKITNKSGRTTEDLYAQALSRPELDDWWKSRMPELSRINVPMLVCGSFSDHLLHTRGSFEAFRRVSSKQKWIWTHRGGKWCVFYGDEAKATQLRFFEHFLAGADNGWDQVPPVRIAIHETGDAPAEIRMAADWPPPGVTWSSLHLRSGGQLAENPETSDTSMVFVNSNGSLKFRWQVPAACDLIGPMTFNADVSLEGASDATLLVAVRLIRGGVEVPFEGSYGFGHDVVTHGWHRLAHRELDTELSTPWQPVHTHAKAEPFSPGEIVPISVALLPQATRLRAGDVLELELRSQWLFAMNPFTGQLPARYAVSSNGSTRLHLGGSHLAELRVPVAGG
jgi:putative CocE/NonD family hydrolase